MRRHGRTPGTSPIQMMIVPEKERDLACSMFTSLTSIYSCTSASIARHQCNHVAVVGTAIHYLLYLPLRNSRFIVRASPGVPESRDSRGLNHHPPGFFGFAQENIFCEFERGRTSTHDTRKHPGTTGEEGHEQVCCTIGGGGALGSLAISAAVGHTYSCGEHLLPKFFIVRWPR